MPDHFASFKLDFITPDLFQKIVKKAVSQGIRIKGNHGNYIDFHMGDILLIIRTAYDLEKDLDYITGFDSHIKGCCVWECVIDKEIEHEDLTEKTVLIKSNGISLPLPLINGDILPSYAEGTVFQAQIAAYPQRIAFQKEETGGMIVTREDQTVSICGKALGFREGKTVYTGGLMTRFIICLLETDHGEIELAFPGEMVDKNQDDLLCPGTYVRCRGTLTGNPAIFDLEKGCITKEEQE